jgi:hypothetical protein
VRARARLVAPAVRACVPCAAHRNQRDTEAQPLLRARSCARTLVRALLRVSVRAVALGVRVRAQPRLADFSAKEKVNYEEFFLERYELSFEIRGMNQNWFIVCIR